MAVSFMAEWALRAAFGCSALRRKYVFVTLPPSHFVFFADSGRSGLACAAFPPSWSIVDLVGLPLELLLTIVTGHGPSRPLPPTSWAYPRFPYHCRTDLPLRCASEKLRIRHNLLGLILKEINLGFLFQLHCLLDYSESKNSLPLLKAD